MDIETKKSLAKEIHKTAIEKGWWDRARNESEIRMLIITELSEAVEADRNNRKADINSYLVCLDEHPDNKKYLTEMFEFHIKDTIEDELADTYIRILDYLYFKKSLSKSVINNQIQFLITNNFAESIFNICGFVQANKLNYAMLLIETLCERRNIDLKWHIEAKMEYNSNRSYKHGGKKY